MMVYCDFEEESAVRVSIVGSDSLQVEITGEDGIEEIQAVLDINVVDNLLGQLEGAINELAIPTCAWSKIKDEGCTFYYGKCGSFYAGETLPDDNECEMCERQIIVVSETSV